jgi:predicted RNase H-like nuclease (RuvC/YqgF family)
LAPEVSFTSRIHNLQAEHDRLAHKLERLHDQTQTDLVTKQEKDKKIQQLQSDLDISRKYAQRLEHENVDLSSNAKYFKNRAAKSGQVLNQALSILQELSLEPPISPWRESIIAAGQRELQETHAGEELE